MLMDEKTTKNILARLDRLEKAVFISGNKKTSAVKQEEFSGPKGGILFLASKRFFNKCKTAPEVKDELEKNDYNYRIQVVQTALNRLTKNKGPLTALSVGGKKVY